MLLKSGHIIHKVAELELFIGLYIALKFTNDKEKADEITYMVIPKLNFSTKIEILKVLISQHNPEFYIQNPEFENDIEEIRIKRNIVAHQYLNTSSDAIDRFKTTGSIYFLKLKDKMKLDEFNDEKLDNILKKIYSCIEAMKIIA
jgi:hypothetical protein